MAVNFDLIKEYNTLAKTVAAGANIVEGEVVGNLSASGMIEQYSAANAAPTAGTATITNVGVLATFGAAVVPAFAPADYDIDVTADGVLYQVTVSLVALDTWAGVAAKIEAALQILTGALETVAISGGQFLFTSATTGAASTMLLAAGTAGSGGGDLLTAIDALGADYVNQLDAPVNGSATGLYNRVYVAQNSFDNTTGADGVLDELGGLRYARVYGSRTRAVVDFDAVAAGNVEGNFYGRNADTFQTAVLGPVAGRILNVYSATRAEVEFI